MKEQTEKQIIKEEVNLYANFWKHLTLYIIFNFVLWIVWLLMGSSLPVWPLYPTVIWGFVVAVHFMISYMEIQKMNKVK